MLLAMLLSDWQVARVSMRRIRKQRDIYRGGRGIHACNGYIEEKAVIIGS